MTLFHCESELSTGTSCSWSFPPWRSSRATQPQCWAWAQGEPVWAGAWTRWCPEATSTLGPWTKISLSDEFLVQNRSQDSIFFFATAECGELSLKLRKEQIWSPVLRSGFSQVFFFFMEKLAACEWRRFILLQQNSRSAWSCCGIVAAFHSPLSVRWSALFSTISFIPQNVLCQC